MSSVEPSRVTAESSEDDREWFWRIVDAQGLANLPSIEEDALRALMQRAEQSEAAQRELSDERAIVDRIWAIFGTPSYEELAGRSIYDLINEVIADRLNFHAEWKKCVLELRDAHTRRKAAEAELSAAVGHLRNAGLDLKCGAPKETALRTINGGLARFEAFLAALGSSAELDDSTRDGS